MSLPRSVTADRDPEQVFVAGTEEFQEFASEAKSIVTWRCWVSNLLESMARFVRGSIEDDICLHHASGHWEGGAAPDL